MFTPSTLGAAALLMLILAAVLEWAERRSNGRSANTAYTHPLLFAAVVLGGTAGVLLWIR